MQVNVKSIAIALVSVGVVFSGTALIMQMIRPSSAAKAEAARKVLRSKKIATKVKPGRVETRIRGQQHADVRQLQVDKLDASAKSLGELLTGDDEKLAAEYKALIRDLQLALADDDKKKILKSIQGLLAAYQSGVKLPFAVLEAMARGAASCGASALPELVGLLAGKDLAVVDVASDSFEEMLMEADGDAELSEMMISVVPYLKDTELLNSVMTELDHMRNSVRVKTALAIFDKGQPEAVKVLSENLSTYFPGEDGAVEVKSREDVLAYGEKYPDGEDDETFYGKWISQEEGE